MALVGKTFGSARDVLVEGALSGLLRVLPQSAVRRWNRNMGELHLANGAMMKCYGATEPDLLRGPEFSMALCDELATWQGRDAWDNLLLACRMGPFPRIIVTTTPARTALFRELAHDPRVLIHRESTYANLENLPQSFKASILDRYEGTARGRQEIMGELLEDVEGALWTMSELDALRVIRHEPPFWNRMIVGLDPADGLAEGDEQGLVLVGQSPEDQHFYVIQSEGYRLRPWDYLKEAVLLASRYKASIVVEKNHGGQFLLSLMNEVMDKLEVFVPVEGIPATQSKRDRAQMIVGLYQQGRVHHVGYHSQLEDEMTTWTGLPGQKEASPNRLDALVHALCQFPAWRPVQNQRWTAAVPYVDHAPFGVTNPAIPWA